MKNPFEEEICWEKQGLEYRAQQKGTSTPWKEHPRGPLETIWEHEEGGRRETEMI